MAEENAMGGQNMNEGVHGDVPPVQAYELPKNLGRYYRRLVGCCAGGMFSIVFGVLGLLAWAAAAAYAILCFATGLVALGRIRRSQGNLKGNGYVIASIVMPLVMVPWLFSFIVAYPVGLRSMMWQERLFYIGDLGRLLIQYRNEQGGSLPRSDQWCDVLKNVNEGAGYLFGGSKDGTYSSDFALNRAATEVIGELPDELVLLFESEPGWNRVGGPELLAGTDKTDFVRVYLVGAEAQLVRRSEADGLRWTAEVEPAVAATPRGGYWALGTSLGVTGAAIIVGLRKYLRQLVLAALGVGVLSVLAGTVCGFMAEGLYATYSSQQAHGVGGIAGGLIGFLTGVCFVLVLGYARDRMRPGVSMVGFATVAGAITGAAASTAVHVFLMIGYNDFHLMYPAAGAGFGIWAGIVLGWIGSGLVPNKKPAAVVEFGNDMVCEVTG
ncbi:MAG: hypothetical protein IH624_05450 [Phycisphaerae bacterium]|nr:hypothetical protein [Phycisphaerae bacterium]